MARLVGALTGALLGVTGACGEDGGAASADACVDAADFTPCRAPDDAAGRCLDGACAALPPCGPAGCAEGLTFPLADTSLVTCQAASGPVECAGIAGSPDCAGTAGCGQDAQYGWDTRNARATRFSVAGAGGEPVVTDAVTGLVWMGCAKGQATACAGDATRGSWHDARAFCDASVWGGHDDWTLPDPYALQSIVDYSTTSPAIDREVFANAPSRFALDSMEWWVECTWTATDVATDADAAWAVLVNSGDVLAGSGVPYHVHDKAADGWVGCYTRCVRAHAPPAHGRFLARGTADEPVVTDVVARRHWMGCSVGQSGAGCAGEATQLAWTDALATCEALVWGGYDDWRLPDVVELRSLVDLGASRPAIDGAYFPNTPFYDGVDDLRGQYWTSTARWYNAFALYVSFHDGGSHFYVMDEGRHVRCVRGG